MEVGLFDKRRSEALDIEIIWFKSYRRSIFKSSYIRVPKKRIYVNINQQNIGFHGLNVFL